ncbi:lytic murein transglycosylase [Leucobacter rhizosphaerae]|uniref:Lytic murein transglycosylase n=1 Tax=Leucobacter rhizosphaerae TaxID=2932245 RepID=A0ABY4FVJ0_9MICO|nr:lytic murein transglycosylase [Leucobacter rhizosphaerae]UOQ60326.1 lytic murein transglycosylase [Leucobacter rhizosphaerae]
MSGGKWLLIGALGTGLAGVALVVGAILFGTAAAGPMTAGAGEADGTGGTAPRAAQQADPAVPVGDGLRVDPVWVQETAAATGIGDRALAAYTHAVTRVAEEFPECRIGWNTLAGIGYVESYHGTINGSALDASGTATPPILGIPLDGTQRTMAIPDTDGGALDGDAVWDRAVGPMQFIPSTWVLWGVDGDGDGIADPQNIDDASLSAARYLCGIGGDLADPERWIAAVAAYNDTVEYNHRVADAATHYAGVVG